MEIVDGLAIVTGLKIWMNYILNVDLISTMDKMQVVNPQTSVVITQ
jgi:hypothetical protein